MNPSRIIALTFLLLLGTSTSFAQTREEQRVADASDVLDQFMRIPEQAIPSNLLARAYAIAVVPKVVKLGFGLGGRRGRGIIVVRQSDNTWSAPAFIALTGGSIGWQIGAQSTDVILVFKTRAGVDGISNGKLTLGADASVAAGPVGRQAGAATDLQLEAEVVSYSRNRGLFAGVSFEGSGVTMDRRANAAFYGDPSMTPERILASSPAIAPDVARRFVTLLSAQTSELPTQPGMQDRQPSQQTMPAGEQPATESEEVKTFGIPDPDDPEAGNY